MKKEGVFGINEIKIDWKGPLSVEDVIKDMNNGGVAPHFDGPDYGVYQIYGKHILCGSNTLLYVGKATKETFSERLADHQEWWLHKEEEIEVYIGRIEDPQKYTPKDNWDSWYRDVRLAENILIYKYSPHYNSAGISEEPSLATFEKVVLIHKGAKHKLRQRDTAPNDYV
jgi:hypothetical protein